MKFYAVNRWNNNRQLFVCNNTGCATPEQAEAEGRQAATTYRDHEFVCVIRASNWNAAKASVDTMEG